jgi:hypothetical protein
LSELDHQAFKSESDTFLAWRFPTPDSTPSDLNGIDIIMSNYINFSYDNDPKTINPERQQTHAEDILKDIAAFTYKPINENQSRERTIIFELLSKDPTFTLPSKDFKGFSKFEPIEDDGLDLSEIIIRDRR